MERMPRIRETTALPSVFVWLRLRIIGLLSILSIGLLLLSGALRIRILIRRLRRRCGLLINWLLIGLLLTVCGIVALHVGIGVRCRRRFRIGRVHRNLNGFCGRWIAYVRTASGTELGAIRQKLAAGFAGDHR